MGKRISDTTIRVDYHIRPEDMNQYGSIHGGRLLTLADETGFLAAHRHSEQRCLTVGVHQARFFRGAQAGMHIEIEAQIVLAGHTSLWVPIRMSLADGVGDTVMKAVYVYVAVDEHGRPTPVPAAIAETEEERAMQARILAMREAFRGGRP